MNCPECHYQYEEDDTYCRNCGEELLHPSTSLVTTTQSRLPALQYSQFSRKVVASVGAVALGVGIELLRRSLLTRLTSIPRSIERTLPALSDLKDIARSNRTVKVPKGYIIDETIVYTRRVIRRER